MITVGKKTIRRRRGLVTRFHTKASKSLYKLAAFRLLTYRDWLVFFPISFFIFLIFFFFFFLFFFVLFFAVFYSNSYIFFFNSSSSTSSPSSSSSSTPSFSCALPHF